MLIIPYNTDAPIYYLPIVTVGLIVVNVLVFVLQVTHPEHEQWMLAIGDGIHLQQWVSHNFLHADPLHLIGNMIFLWVFGLIVEGKLGHWKILLTYLAIGAIHGAVVQLTMLNHTPTYALGASAAIYGLMAMSLIWAPENCIHCYIRFYHVEVPIKFLVVFYVGLDVFFLIGKKGALSTELLHSIGAVIGTIAGIVLLKTKVVDCEGWDIFSVLSGQHKSKQSKRETPEDLKEKEAKREARKNRKLEEIREALKNNYSFHAATIYLKSRQEFPNWVLPEKDLLRMIQSLMQKNLWPQAVIIGKDYLKHYTAKAAAVRLNLAQSSLNDHQPGQAMKFLRQVDFETLAPKEKLFYQKLRKNAQQILGNTYFEQQ